MMTCQQLTELITDYLEGRLSFWRRLEFHLHVGMCKHCRAYLRQMQETIRALGQLPPEPIPADVKAELMARLRTMRPPK